jgi:hypothetical protein
MTYGLNGTTMENLLPEYVNKGRKLSTPYAFSNLQANR